MKKFWLFIVGLCVVFFAWSFTQAKDYEYTNLDITANILIDGAIDVKEDFTANFFVNKHWIIRSIPLNYSVWWNDFHIDISDINVQWKTFTTNKTNWNIEIKIWDANRTVIWQQRYPISYSTYGLIRNFSWMWYAELYWNLVWYDFDTNINKVRAELILPKSYTNFTNDDFLITTDWTSKTIDWFEGSIDWSKWDRIIITYDKWLSTHQWITLAIKFPNDYFNFDHERQNKLLGFVKDSWWDSSLSSFLWFFYGLFSLYFVIFARKLIKKVWKTEIKPGVLKWDFAKQFPVIVQYEPPQWINSAEAWLLLHRWSRVKDMLSLIYKRAAQWLITLSTEKTGWSFLKKSTNYVIITKNMDIPKESPTYEINTFNSLIRNEKNKIRSSSNLYNKLSLYGLETYGIDNWWFDENQKWKLIGLLPVWIAILTIIFIDIYPLLSLFWFFCILFFELFSKWWSKLKETEEWAELISHVLWYRKFLKACDENKLRSFLKQDPLYFDKILPYAVVFWLDTELIKKIEPIMHEMNIKSSWYNEDFHSISMINNIISNSATSSVSSSSSSSSYSSSGWFSSGSSFSWWWGWFSSWWGGWWWGWRSW